MALIYPVNGITPDFGKRCKLAENAVITGDVILGDDCSVWFHAVVRGDVHHIRIGNKVNIQDHALVHCTYQRAATKIGDNVSIGHGAIVHGCTIASNVLIGMRAVVMDHAVVEEKAIVAAGAVVLENTIVESGYIYAGVPAKKVKAVDRSLFEGEIQRIANNYLKYASWYNGKGIEEYEPK